MTESFWRPSPSSDQRVTPLPILHSVPVMQRHQPSPERGGSRGTILQVRGPRRAVRSRGGLAASETMRAFPAALSFSPKGTMISPTLSHASGGPSTQLTLSKWLTTNLSTSQQRSLQVLSWVSSLLLVGVGDISGAPTPVQFTGMALRSRPSTPPLRLQSIYATASGIHLSICCPSSAACQAPDRCLQWG